MIKTVTAVYKCQTANRHPFKPIQVPACMLRSSGSPCSRHKPCPQLCPWRGGPGRVAPCISPPLSLGEAEMDLRHIVVGDDLGQRLGEHPIVPHWEGEWPGSSKQGSTGSMATGSCYMLASYTDPSPPNINGRPEQMDLGTRLTTFMNGCNRHQPKL